MLDPSSATELLTHAPADTYVAAPPTKYPAKESPEFEPRYQPQPQRSQPVPAYYNEDAYCKSHPDEEVKYFCFDCQTPPVCSECVVHGIHKGHDVLHIKKALPIIREKLDGVIQGLNANIEDLDADRKGISAKKQVVMAQAEEATGQTKTMLDDLRARIDKKEREIMGRIEIVMNDSLRELESYERIMEEKLGTLTNNVKYIKENMATGPQGTLCFYAENNKILHQALEQDAKVKDQYVTQLLNRSQQLDNEALRGLKEGVAAIADSVSRLKAGTIGKSGSEKRETGTAQRTIRENVGTPLNEEYS